MNKPSQNKEDDKYTFQQKLNLIRDYKNHPEFLTSSELASTNYGYTLVGPFVGPAKGNLQDRGISDPW